MVNLAVSPRASRLVPVVVPFERSSEPILLALKKKNLRSDRCWQLTRRAPVEIELCA